MKQRSAGQRGIESSCIIKKETPQFCKNKSIVFDKNSDNKENQIQSKRLFSETCDLDDPKIMTFRAVDAALFKNIRIAFESQIPIQGKLKRPNYNHQSQKVKSAYSVNIC